MSTLVFDLEAVLLPGISHTEGDKLPAAPNWRIVCLCALLLNDDFTVNKVVDLGTDEEPMLRGFARGMNQERPPTLIGFNSRAFDAPVIEARMMHHGIPCARMFSRDVQDRYYSGHVDLMDRIANCGAATRASLDACAKLIGFPGKVGTDGADVASMVAADRIDEVRAYCLCDVVQTAAIFMRREYVRGAVDGGRYEAAASSLLDLVDADARLEAIRSGIDRDRFLLGERCRSAKAG